PLVVRGPTPDVASPLFPYTTLFRSGRYRPGRREWIKVKRIRTADCVVVGVAGEESAPMLVLALRHTDGELRHCGLTRPVPRVLRDRKSTRLNSSHLGISYAVFCLKK